MPFKFNLLGRFRNTPESQTNAAAVVKDGPAALRKGVNGEGVSGGPIDELDARLDGGTNGMNSEDIQNIADNLSRDSTVAKTELNDADTAFKDSSKSGEDGSLPDTAQQIPKFTDEQINALRTDLARATEKIRLLEQRVPPTKATALQKLRAFLADNSYKIAGGIAVSSIAIHSHLVHEGTDGETVDITSVFINADASQATISYSRPGSVSPVYFQPAVGDTITINNIPILGSSPDFRIIEVINDNQIKIDLAHKNNDRCLQPFKNKTMCEGTAATACSPGPSGCGGSESAPTFTCHSDFGNQFLSNWRATLRLIGSAIGGALGIVINEAGNVVTSVISPIVSTTTQILGAVGSAGGKAFCTLLPIFCDSTIWLIILAALVGVIIFVAIK